MYGKCKDCAKLMSCNNTRSFKFGFCETDFEPREKPQLQSNAKGMTWVQLSSSAWEAVGSDGKFRIERSKGKFWPKYASRDTAFNLPPRSSLSEAKELCQDNLHWEGVA